MATTPFHGPVGLSRLFGKTVAEIERLRRQLRDTPAPPATADAEEVIAAATCATDSAPAAQGNALLPVARSAQRLACTVHDLAKEVVLRVDQPVGQVQGGVDDLLPRGWMLIAE